MPTKPSAALLAERARNATLQAEVARLTQANADLWLQLENRNAGWQRISSWHAARAERLSAALVDVRARNATLQAEVDRLAKARTHYASLYETVHSNLGTLQADHAAQIEAANAALAKINAAHAELMESRRTAVAALAREKETAAERSKAMSRQQSKFDQQRRAFDGLAMLLGELKAGQTERGASA